MIIQYDPVLIKKLKKLNIRIRKSFKQAMVIFSRNPEDPRLKNHPLKKEYVGYRSINITVDWRAMYKEIYENKEVIAYFITIGTHDELYQ